MIAHFVLFLLRPLPDFSLATWDLAPLSHHHMYKRHHMLIADEDLSIPELSSRNKRNRRKLYYNLQKVWDSSDSLNGNSCSLFIFIRSTIPVISGDFLTPWNAIIVRKGRDKGQFLGNSYFWIEVLGLNYLTKEPPSFPTFQVKARLYVNFIAVPKHSFLDSFLCCCLVYKIFAVTIRNITP